MMSIDLLKEGLSLLTMDVKQMEYRIIFSAGVKFNSSPPSVAYMRRWIASALVQAMACRRICYKPLPKPTTVKFESKYKKF